MVMIADVGMLFQELIFLGSFGFGAALMALAIWWTERARRTK